jgi:hypothetical protein
MPKSMSMPTHLEAYKETSEVITFLAGCFYGEFTVLSTTLTAVTPSSGRLQGTHSKQCNSVLHNGIEVAKRTKRSRWSDVTDQPPGNPKPILTRSPVWPSRKDVKGKPHLLLPVGHARENPTSSDKSHVQL